MSEKRKSLIFSLYEQFKNRGKQEDVEDGVEAPLEEAVADAEILENHEEAVESEKSEGENKLEEMQSFLNEISIKVPKPAFNPNDLLFKVCHNLGYDIDYMTEDNIHIKKFHTLLKSIAKAYDHEEFSEKINAKAYVSIATTGREAYLFIFPPVNDGAEISISSIDELLKEHKIVHGVNRSVISQITKDRKYCTYAKVAEATLPVDGTDGTILHSIEVTHSPDFVEDDQGNVDYKELNMTNNITSDTVICEIIPPQDGINGTKVTGEVIPAKMGKAAIVPRGKNTALSEDGAFLIASCDGRLQLSNNKYSIEKQFTTSGDVDFSTGNINFVGDILVKGDVKAGFTLRAAGSIFIKGLAEGCTLIAGGDIVIHQGMNGDEIGNITAGGEIKAKYLENCKASSVGGVNAGSIINCEIESEGPIVVTKERGIIVGGKILTSKTLEAKIIGSKSERLTLISLGKTKKERAAFAQLKEEYTTIKLTAAHLVKNLEQFEPGDESDPSKRIIINQLKAQQKLYNDKMGALSIKIKIAEKELYNTKNMFVKASTIFQPTIISIANNRYRVGTTMYKTMFYNSDDGIKTGQY